MKKLYRTFAVSAALLAGAPNVFASKTLAFLLPPDFSDWTFQTPMVSMDGGVTGKAASVMADKCGWYSYTFDNEITDNVVIYRSNDTEREDLLGVNGNWEFGAAVTPIPLGTFFDAYDVDTLYFIPDYEQFLNENDDGWYTFFPEGAEGICSHSLLATSYPASQKEIAELDKCGSQCVTDNDKFNAIFGTTKTEDGCADITFAREADYSWTFTYDKRHATCTALNVSFIKQPGQQISVHNASLAWMFINGEQATTKEGDHNGVVLDMDSFTGASGALENGKTYDLRLFYCDQESSLDNIQISSSLDLTTYLDNNVSIYATPVKDRTSPATTTYDICYAVAHDFTCSLAGIDLGPDQVACGADIKKLTNGSEITYYLTKYGSLDMTNAVKLLNGSINKGGIDLTNPYVPKVDKKEMFLEPGRWTLFVDINGKLKKLASFRSTATVEILTAAEADVLDTNGNMFKDMHYTSTREIVAGVPTPVYISAIIYDGTETNLSPYDAIGATYMVYTNNPAVHLYEKTGESEYSIVDGQNRVVGNSGVDTLYIFMDQKALSEDCNKATVSINGLQNVEYKFKAGSALGKVVMGIQTVARNASSSKSYAIYNTKGQMIKKGMLSDGAQLTVPTSGTYIVRMGNTTRVMKFK